MRHLVFLITFGLLSLVVPVSGMAAEPETAAQDLPAIALDFSGLEKLAIQEGGRIKPFDTFARESLQLITGKQTRNGKRPSEVIISWLFLPDHWAEEKFIEVKHLELKKIFGMPPESGVISPKELSASPQLTSLLTDLAQHQKDKKKQTPYYAALSRLNNQISLYQSIISGQVFRLIPQTLSNDWIMITDLKGETKEAFAGLAGSYFESIRKKSPSDFSMAVEKFKSVAKSQAPEKYPSDAELNREILYNSVHPFRVAFIFYLTAAILLLFSLRFLHSRAWYGAGIVTTYLGLAVHTIGFVYRCVIAGRPPVSNMYESIIWVALGCVVFGLVFEHIYKRRYVLLAATAVATLGLIIGDSAPAVLDQSIRPLEPVLRSNYWLTIHVLTITLSYGAFALASGIGNIALWQYIRGRANSQKEKLDSLARFVYRAVQVGVLLLTAGTILGGVWADYSWGRFWGWDPKETWALIADLMYLAILHGRFSGWLRSFGTIAASVCCFVGVIMAWYGVNFVLGVGLHSYGFGGGGLNYVSGAVIAQLLYVAWAAAAFRATKA